MLVYVARLLNTVADKVWRQHGEPMPPECKPTDALVNEAHDWVALNCTLPEDRQPSTPVVSMGQGYDNLSQHWAVCFPCYS
jgi:hypothetical protein